MAEGPLHVAQGPIRNHTWPKDRLRGQRTAGRDQRTGDVAEGPVVVVKWSFDHAKRGQRTDQRDYYYYYYYYYSKIA